MNLECKSVPLYRGMSNKIELNCWIVGNIAIYGSDRRYQLYHAHTGLGITMNYATDKRKAMLAALSLQLLPLEWETSDESTIARDAMNVGQNIFREIMIHNGMYEA